jgi:Ser/Thr protein kinase RdoA (MazF antagonist)
MNKTRVEPDWPPLGFDEVRALLRQFPDCEEPHKILTVSPRPFSAASVVATRQGRLFIKRHARTVRDRDGLLEEHRFLAHLRKNGAPVPQLFQSASGESAIEVGKWTYEVHEAPAGVDIYADALSWMPFQSTYHAYSAGRALATLHLASAGFDAPARGHRMLVAGFTIFAGEDAAAGLAQYLGMRPALEHYLVQRSECDDALELLASFHAELRPLLPLLSPLWTHNDLHASNLLWSDAGDQAEVTTIFDFGLADRTNAVHDLAHAIERNMVEWLELAKDSRRNQELPVHWDHLFALLDGYESVRPLDQAEAASLAPMIALCHAEFALSEAEYFLDVLRFRAHVKVCIEEYLVGHARWFHSAGGRRMLDAVRTWAGAKTRGLRRMAHQRLGER